MRLQFIVGALVLTAVAVAHGETGLTGRVVDQSGAGVPRAEVRVGYTAEDALIVVLADARGGFAVPGLRPAKYDVLAVSAGFAPAFRSAVEVRAGNMTAVELVLAVSPLQQSIVVSAKTAQAESMFDTIPYNSREILEIREVRESAAKDVGEAAANLEGLWKIRKGGIANDVVLRGFQQGNLNVLIDGGRVGGACPNHMDPAAFHVDFAETELVQVTKGPFDIRNQGSLGGTVEVVARKPPGTFRIAPAAGAGSFGYYNPSLTASYAIGKLNGLAGYSYRRSDPYRDGSGKRVTEYSNYSPGGQRNAAFDINTGWTRFALSLPHSQTVAFGYTRQQSGLTLYPYLLMDSPYDNADRANASWTLRSEDSFVRQISANTYFTAVRHWMTDELRASSVGAPRGYSMATFASTKTMGVRAEIEIPHTFVGFEAYRRNWDALNTMRMAGMYMDQPSMPGVWITSGGLYLQHRRTLGRLAVVAGTRLDAVSSEARRQSLNTNLFWAYHGTHSTSASNLNPSGTLWVTYGLGPEVELFAGIGSTVRVPDPQERYFALKRNGTDWVGNPNLNPVRNTETDFGFNIHARRFSLRPTVFYSRLTNFIALYSQPIVRTVAGVMNKSARTYESVDGYIRGGEVTFSVAFDRSLLLAGGLSYARGVQYGKIAGMPHTDMAEMPPLKSRMSLRYGRKLYFGEVEGRAVARQDKVDRRLLESPTPGYGVLNVRGGVHHRSLNLAAGIENALGRLYYDHLSFQRDPFRLATRLPDPGRSLFLSLSIAFE